MSKEYVDGWNGGVASVDKDALRREGVMIAFDIAMDFADGLLDDWCAAIADNNYHPDNNMLREKADTARLIAKAINEARRKLGDFDSNTELRAENDE